MAKNQSSAVSQEVASAHPAQEELLTDMASTSASRGAAAPEATEEPTEAPEPEVRYPGSQQNLYSYGQLAWESYKENQLVFAAFSPFFTIKLADEQLAFIKKTEELPDVEARRSVPEEARLFLEADNLVVTDLFQRGKWYIKKAFPDPATGKLKLKAAGNEHLKGALDLDWESTTSLISSFKKFLTENAGGFGEDNMPTDFPKSFNDAADAFLAKWLAYKKKLGLALKATNTKLSDNDTIYLALNEMCEAGKLIFKKNVLVRQKFVIARLLKEVRGKQPSGAKGIVSGDNKKMPIANAQLSAVNTDPTPQSKEYSATTDKEGKYELKMAAGVYNITVTAPGFEPFTVLNRVVKIGILGRLDIKLVKTLDALSSKPLDSAISALLETPAEKSAKPMPSEEYTNGVTV